MFIGTESGKILRINNGNIDCEWSCPSGRRILGIRNVGRNVLLACDHANVYALDHSLKITSQKYLGEFEFHHFEVTEHIYLTGTWTNEIVVVDTLFNIIKRVPIKPPYNGPIIYKQNYNHINNIFYNNNRFYVDLNWLNTQHGMSGYAVLDQNMSEIGRYTFGWESHGFRIDENKRMCLCATTNKPTVTHPKKSGLMVEEVLVFEHDTSIFCKGLTVDKDHIYMSGGEQSDRDSRAEKDGIIFKLDKSYNLIEKHRFKGTGGFCGITL